MSAPHDTAAHDAAHDPSAHHPHVLPISTYMGIFFTLLVLTGVTVGVSYVDLGNANLFIALAVATAKALCVALVFMHLLFDKKFNAIVFSSALIFLAIFIGFTMADTSFRGYDGRSSADGPVDVQNPFGGTRSQMAVERMFAKQPAGPENPQNLPVGPKTDIGLHDATPVPMGDSVTVDIPPASMGRQAIKAEEKKE